MKNIYFKQEGETLLVKNTSGQAEIVLIFPVTRDEADSEFKWKSILDFVEDSEISTLLVFDKTEKGVAGEFFMENFDIMGKNLFVLPRSINDTLFDTAGEIVLEDNMWIFQLHDDDQWKGKISLPQTPHTNQVYYSDYYLKCDGSESLQISDFSMPNRIVFSLLPAMIWNRFAKVVQDQKHHVAGSFDFTLNMMAHLVCRFEYQPGFQYFWKDDNWRTSKQATEHLTKLAENDGWEAWSSPEIANLNRSIDSIAALNYVKDFLEPNEISDEIRRLVKFFSPKFRKRLKYGLYILNLIVLIKARYIFYKVMRKTDQKLCKLQSQLIFYRFISDTWRIKSLDQIIDSIDYMESRVGLEKLQHRFQFWKQSISELR